MRPGAALWQTKSSAKAAKTPRTPKRTFFSGVLGVLAVLALRIYSGAGFGWLSVNRVLTDRGSFKTRLHAFALHRPITTLWALRFSRYRQSVQFYLPMRPMN